MKQTITKEQWDELSDKEKKKVLKHFSLLKDKWIGFYMSDGMDLTIGKMIEFLEDDLYHIDNYNEWNLETAFGGGLTNKELIDALWEACKAKLKV